VNRPITHRIAVALAGMLLGMSVWLPFQMMGHAKIHHTHHQAATHASPFCTLLCSAGQMAQITDPTPHFGQPYLYHLEFSTFTSHLTVAVSPLLARGPPSHFPSSVII